MKRYGFIGWLLLWFCTPLPAAQLPPDFSADYRLVKYDVVVAEMHLSLQRQDSMLIYRSHSEPRGLAALLSNEEIHETSRLVISDKTSTPHLLSYQNEYREKSKKNQQFHIERSQSNEAMARGSFNTTDFELRVEEPVWDRLSVQLALTCQTAASTTIPQQFSYRVLDRGELTEYQFEYLGESVLKIGEHTYTTLRFKRAHGKRSTYLWLAKELHYLPVQIEQHKKGKLNLRMTLDRIKL